MIKKEDVYCIGKIGKTHGVRGELTFLFYDDVFERTGSSCLILEVDGILVPFFFEECRFKNDTTAIVKFCDVDTQSKAQQLTSCEVFFPRKHNDDTIKQLSWAQIISFTLVDVATHRSIGKIAHIDASTINILFELEDGTLIPAHHDLIKHVDVEKKTIFVDVPDGLID